MEAESKEAQCRREAAAKQLHEQQHENLQKLKEEQLDERKIAITRAEHESATDAVGEGEQHQHERDGSVKQVDELKRKIATRQLELVEALAAAQAEVRAAAWAKAANTLRQ